MSGTQVVLTIHPRRGATATMNGHQDPDPEAMPPSSPSMTEDPNIKYVRRGYKEYFKLHLICRNLVLPCILIYGLLALYPRLPTLMQLVTEHTQNELRYAWILTILIAIALTSAVVYRLWRKNIYVLEFITFKPPEELKVSHETFNQISKGSGYFTQESLDFQAKLLSRSQVSGDAYFPPGIMNRPCDLSMTAARREAEMVMFGCIDQLLQKTGIHPHKIDILVVNCSLFCPTPSLASMIVHHFKMKTGIKSFNLGGMGCSAGLIAIDLAKDMLLLHKNAYALVVSMENITQNWYHGNEKGMLISNTLFRMGGAAVLLSNRSSDRRRSKFRLVHTVRTHKGADTAAYQVVFQDEDAKGNRGVALSKDILLIASDALRTNITTLGPLVLPYSEQIKYFINLIARSILKNEISLVPGKPFRTCLRRLGTKLLYLPRHEERSYSAKMARFCRRLAQLDTPSDDPEKLNSIFQKYPDGLYSGKSYTPNFRKAFSYFCIHAGGRAVIDAIEEHLSLSSKDVEASRYTLSRYGNTSSSSIWYEMEYHVLNSNMKKGQRVWQIAFGSGFKCNSAVWEVL